MAVRTVTIKMSDAAYRRLSSALTVTRLTDNAPTVVSEFTARVLRAIADGELNVDVKLKSEGF